MDQRGRLAIFGTWVMAVEEGAPTVLVDRWVLAEGGRIVAVQKARPSADIVLDAPGRFVLPGLLNLHNHCFSEMVVRNRTEDGAAGSDTGLVYGLLMPLSRLGIERLTSDQRRAACMLGLLQVIKGGATTLMEPFRNGLPEMFEAAVALGLRFWGAPYLFSSADPRVGADGAVAYRATGADDGAADLATWDTLHARWDGAEGGRIRVAMSPHATDTCGPDLMRAARRRADETGAPITTHVAQSVEEVATIAARYGGRTPIEYLDWTGVLGPDLLAAHCVYATDDDLVRLRSKDATVLNCPRTFARVGTRAAFARFHGAGLRTTIATDGYTTDLMGELAVAGLVSKLEAGTGSVATAKQLLAAVTTQAARAVGRDDLGVIQPGAAADLTLVDLSKPHCQPVADPVRAVVWMAQRGDLDAIVVDGRVLVAGGQCVIADEAEIVANGAAAIKAVWELPDAVSAFSAL